MKIFHILENSVALAPQAVQGWVAVDVGVPPDAGRLDAGRDAGSLDAGSDAGGDAGGPSGDGGSGDAGAGG